ncbi:MAG: 3-hydroxyacyl-CoA dehydrogenase family protein [Rhodospirillales bacterium]|jgi:3-hydroxybutyryl-CoA dehydrogenase|nr:3-hydroxyacyl-CoA dehydrogenase family protein [Rhodospirillales bacterium]
MSEIAVIGAGTMGHALALVFALGGHQVRLTDSSAATLARAPALMLGAVATLAEAGEVAADAATRRVRSVRLCDTLADTVHGAELVIEAIIEQPEPKRAMFAELDRLMAPDAILASNTSNLDVFPLIPAARQRRAAIAHWYTPPYLCDLVDVVPGPETDPAVIETLRAMVAAMGKEPVVFKTFVQGYVANRIQAAIGLEVQHLLDSGAVTPRDIDRSVLHGIALRMPIVAVLAKADFTGLELLRDLMANRSYTPPEPRDHSETLDRLIAAGRTGVMAGRGYFDWGGRTPEDLFRERDRKLLALKRALREIKPMEGS